jgi:hypothetical protein
MDATDRIVTWKQNESYFNAYGDITLGVARAAGVTLLSGDTLVRNGERLIEAVAALRRDRVLAEKIVEFNPPPVVPDRRRLPQTRNAINHHFEIAGTHGNFDGYISVGRYEDGKIGEIFMASGKGGSTLDGMLKVIGTSTSLLLQYGVPFEVLARKFSNIRFEPNGPTRTEEVRFAKSIIDYIFRWVALNFSPELKMEWTPRVDSPGVVIATDRDVPAEGNSCPECGDSNLRHEGNCWRCPACFWISGGCGG